MAFAVTAYKAYGNTLEQPVTKRFEYTIEMAISNLAADVDADIGDASGNFWTEAEADGTYGAIATEARKIMQDIQAKASSGSFDSEVLNTGLVRVAGAPSGATEYQVAAYTKHVPEIAFFAANAPTSWMLTLKFRLKNGEWINVDKAGGSGI